MICFSEFRPTRIAWTAAYVALGGLALIPLSGAPAIADDDVQSRRIRIEYAPPKSPEIEPYYQLVMQRKALEKVQELLFLFMLLSEISVRITVCGISNAWYQRHSVSICY